MSYFILHPATLRCHHKVPHRGKYGHAWFQILVLSKIIYSNYSFQKLSVNQKGSYGGCFYCFINGLQGLPYCFSQNGYGVPYLQENVAIFIWMLPKSHRMNMSVSINFTMFQCPKHTVPFTLWGGFPKLHFIQISILC